MSYDGRRGVKEDPEGTWEFISPMIEVFVFGILSTKQRHFDRRLEGYHISRV